MPELEDMVPPLAVLFDHKAFCSLTSAILMPLQTHADRQSIAKDMAAHLEMGEDGVITIEGFESPASFNHK
jgi:hypothetical protein